MKSSRKTCVACASVSPSRGPRARVRLVHLLFLGALLLAPACGARADAPPSEAPPPPPPLPELAVTDAWARAVDSGGMAAVYFTITNTAAVPDTLAGVRTGAAEDVGIHMSMQQGRMMHMVALKSLPVPAHDSVLFVPFGAHVMFTRMTRRYAPGDTIPFTLSFVSGQSIEVRAGVRQP